MQVTMFKGLLPVNLPDSWFEKPKAIRFARDGKRQLIDFSQCGGKALAFWVSSPEESSRVDQHWAEVDPAAIAWDGDASTIDSRRTVSMFGQSSDVLDLEHL